MAPWRRASFRICGDRGLLVELGDEISPQVNRRVRQLAAALEAHPPPGLLEVIPAYSSLFLYYDPLETSPWNWRNGWRGLTTCP